jgi:predicted nucleic acid-binding protein
VSTPIWDGGGPVLADTSAWAVMRREPLVRERFLAAGDRGDIAWCWPVRYELLYDARGEDGLATVDRMLEGLREVPVDRGVQRSVLGAMRELAAGGSHGAHRFPLADLTVAVAAQAAGLAVLHYDGHFDELGRLLGVDSHWIADPASR